ncbi:ATP-dependent Clp protease proteolytic subunit, putative [Theileria annulata]|uniref:ATP-dependent Clp protease proteolytic subunit n=1 Tax=Theileria annulata TaxID=5874 RepID=Q4UBQ0_THEAN|nr:ATP-dependent Clp protease proteolytic subunit, putative [Theileria annulata]CAI75751.1 ATP-dependent Clp protease proteolytic subunit, putative [Theileria annulata]|eukprot:XP_955227.1 ATP-dependent Clp protease proteolytic subunit, putative [Theileria annulata]
MPILRFVLILSSLVIHLSEESLGFPENNFLYRRISTIFNKNKIIKPKFINKEGVIDRKGPVAGKKTFFLTNNSKNSNTTIKPTRFYSQLLSLPNSGVAHLVISQLLYLDYDSQDKPIKIYINSDNERSNEDGISTSEIDALNIVDVMNYLKNEVITINLGKAYGPAALILASGTPGKRYVLPRSYTLLRQSPTTLSFRQAEDIAIYSREILKARRSVIKVFSKACNKSEEEILEKINVGDYMGSQETVNFGLADKILENIN